MLYAPRMVGVVVRLLLVATPAALTPAEAFKRVSPSVVMVAAIEGETSLTQGSGVAVGARTIVTNWHVVKSGGPLAVKSSTGAISHAVLISEDTKNDLALLRLVTGDLSPVQIRAGIPEVGEAVVAIGAPQGLERSMSRGIISAVRTQNDDTILLQTDAAISHGSSGGGLFDDRGRLVGITTLSVSTGQALNFAVPAKAVLALMATGLSELAAQRTCNFSSEVNAAVQKRLTPAERRRLSALLEAAPCADEFDPDEYLREREGEDVRPVPSDTRPLVPAPSEKWNAFVARFRTMRADQDYSTGFMLSRELSACSCSVDAEVVLARGTVTGSSERSLSDCAECQIDAFGKWKSRVTRQCALIPQLTSFERGVLSRSDDARGIPERCFATNPDVPQVSVRTADDTLLPSREDGRTYVRIFTNSACVAEVSPGSVQARSGDLFPVPPSAPEVTVSGPCGGFVEVYFGREEKPRLTETFSRTQPVLLRFGR